MSVVEREVPDIMVLAPAERQMFCFGGEWGRIAFRGGSPNASLRVVNH
jgi:hypothetical protein